MQNLNEDKMYQREALKAQVRRENEEQVYWQSQPRIDAGIVIIVVIMLAFGLIMLFSASMSESLTEGSASNYYFVRQSLATVLGVGLMFLITRFDIKLFDKPLFAIVAYMVSLILLILTLFTDPINGARRWLSIPLFGTFQPSELTKVVTVYTIAVYQSWLFKQRATGSISRKTGFFGKINDTFYDIVIPVLIIGVPIAVMSMQTHLSGIIIILIVAFASLLAAGLPKESWIFATIIVGILAAALAVFLVSIWSSLPENITGRFGHIFTRLNIFADSDSVTDDQLYQSNQAFIAIGSGGLFGKGLGMGRQKNNYLPEVQNDYIYSSIVEETGFVGGVFVIILFIAFFILGMRIAYKSSSVYSQIVATGIASLITLQAVLNIAVNVGVVPPTGISLPFFSYGGTSNLFFLIGVGLLLNVSKYGVRRSE